jgi:hypothetical protein
VGAAGDEVSLPRVSAAGQGSFLPSPNVTHLLSGACLPWQAHAAARARLARRLCAFLPLERRDR